LTWRTKPCSPVLIIDDLATSGWHMEEALGLIRGLGLAGFGIVWISGTVQ
jgi:adenine/guanine phosphoribosyltransferase-like PRPP-binding protein